LIEYLHLRCGWPKVLLWPLWPLLWVLSLVFSLVVFIKNWRWDREPPVKPDRPLVISVGNLSAGGTGKTPLGLALVKWLREKEMRVEVILRGYAAHQGFSDEAQLYVEVLGEEAVHQEPDRVLALTDMVSDKADVVLMDDAFQHRRAPRHLDLVLWDLSAPRGESHVLPLGMLREPMSSLRRADAVLMSRSENVPEEEREMVLADFRKMSWGRERFLMTSVPLGLREWPSGEPVSLDDQSCFLVSGIGRPEAFLVTAKRMGLRVAGHHWFGDHHVYTEDDICMIWEEAERVGAEIVVVTSKDVVKWRRGRPVCILEIETQVDERFWGWLKGQLEEMRA